METKDSQSGVNLEESLMTLISNQVLETPVDFSPETNLYETGLDSMAIMQLLLALEEEFSIALPVETVSRKNFSSVRSIAQLLRSKFAGKAIPEVPPSESFAPCLAASRSGNGASIAVSPGQAESEPETLAWLPLRSCDYFVLSFDGLSRRTGQGGHRASSFLILDRVPDVADLRARLELAARRFPMLSARLLRKGFFGSSGWTTARKPVVPELVLFSEENSPGTLLAGGAQICRHAHDVMEDAVNTPLPRPQTDFWAKARFTLIEIRSGGAVLIFSWNHLMIDGVGAELFLEELEDIGSGSSGRVAVTQFAEDADGPEPGWRERCLASRPIVNRFRELVKKPFACLGPRRPAAGRTHFAVHTLTVAETDAVHERCAQLCGALVTMPFYLACVMRAHDRIFARRGLTPESHVCSVPVQVRRKGSRGPLFQNYLTMFFGALERKDLGTLEAAVASLMDQHARFIRERLGESLNDLMHAMSPIPSWLYMTFISLQMKGPFASFFHSHTGEFAVGLDRFLGAEIVNAFHVPGVPTPPGTGIFCNEKNGKLVLTTCWHETVLNDAERELMMNQLLQDLGVA
ncbi:MAG: phosphopantetheine-binding protein [Chthoniobacterales bacterium]